jgi:hypothetical protein
MHSGKVYLKLLIITFIFISCSNPQKIFGEVQKLQDASNQTILQTRDYDIKINVCENTIDTLQKILDKHRENDWSNVAIYNLKAWESRKAAFLQEITSLHNKLFIYACKRQ